MAQTIENLERQIEHLKRENASLRGSVSNSLAILRSVSNLSESYSQSSNMQDLLNNAVNLFTLADAGLISIFDEQAGYDEVVATYNHDSEVFSKVHMKPLQGATGWCYSTGLPRIWNGDDVAGVLEGIEEPTQEYLTYEMGASSPRSSLMCAPIVVRGRPIGAIQIEHYSDERQFSELELQLLVNYVANPLSLALDNIELSDQMQERNEEIRRLLRKTINSQEEERARVARELHDDVAQTLAGLHIAIRNISRFVSKYEDSDDVLSYLAELDESVQKTIETTQRLTTDLRPALLNDRGLVSALTWYLRERIARAGIETHLVVENIDEDELDPMVITTLFRVAQEALSNVIRHGQAENVYVSLVGGDDIIVLDVVDDGVGFILKDDAASKAANIGLNGMEERLSMIGGSFSIQSHLGEGTEVHGEVPLLKKAE